MSGLSIRWSCDRHFLTSKLIHELDIIGNINANTEFSLPKSGDDAGRTETVQYITWPAREIAAKRQ